MSKYRFIAIKHIVKKYRRKTLTTAQLFDSINNKQWNTSLSESITLKPKPHSKNCSSICWWQSRLISKDWFMVVHQQLLVKLLRKQVFVVRFESFLQLVVTANYLVGKADVIAHSDLWMNIHASRQDKFRKGDGAIKLTFVIL